MYNTTRKHKTDIHSFLKEMTFYRRTFGVYILTNRCMLHCFGIILKGNLWNRVQGLLTGETTLHLLMSHGFVFQTRRRVCGPNPKSTTHEHYFLKVCLEVLVVPASTLYGVYTFRMSSILISNLQPLNVFAKIFVILSKLKSS